MKRGRIEEEMVVKGQEKNEVITRQIGIYISLMSRLMIFSVICEFTHSKLHILC